MLLGVDPDLMNSIFAGLSSLFILNHCRVLYREKSVSGLSIISVMFFSVYSYWHLLFFYHLDITFSLVSSVLTFLANVLYMIMLLHYKMKS